MTGITLVIILGYAVIMILGGLCGYVIGFNRGLGWQDEYRRRVAR